MAARSLREALAALRRAPGLAFLSATSIGLSLFVLGLFGLATFNVELTLEEIEKRVEIVAYLRDDVTAVQLEILQNDAGAFPEVQQLTYISKFEAMRNAIQQLDEFREVFADLDVNPLPASIELRLKPEHRNPESVRRVAELLAVYPFVDDVQYGREWLDKIYQLRRLAAAVAVVLGAAFAVVAVLIIGTTIRIAVLARRDEIAVMRLVGATDGFVRRPFLLEGLITGLAGGAIALGLTYTAYLAVNASLIDLRWLPASWAAGGVAAGGTVGLVASALALRRHLRAYV